MRYYRTASAKESATEADNESDVTPSRITSCQPFVFLEHLLYLAIEPTWVVPLEICFSIHQFFSE